MRKKGREGEKKREREGRSEREKRKRRDCKRKREGFGFFSTCAHDAGVHPALPVLDRVAVKLPPASQDVHTAVPLGGADPSGKRVAPVSHQHPAVIVAVYLMIREQSGHIGAVT